MLELLLAERLGLALAPHVPRQVEYRERKLLHPLKRQLDGMQAITTSPMMGIVSGFIRMVGPITAAFYLIKITFRLGTTQKRDK